MTIVMCSTLLSLKNMTASMSMAFPLVMIFSDRKNKTNYHHDNEYLTMLLCWVHETHRDDIKIALHDTIEPLRNLNS